MTIKLITELKTLNISLINEKAITPPTQIECGSGIITVADDNTIYFNSTNGWQLGLTGDQINKSEIFDQLGLTASLSVLQSLILARGLHSPNQFFNTEIHTSFKWEPTLPLQARK